MSDRNRKSGTEKESLRPKMKGCDTNWKPLTETECCFHFYVMFLNCVNGFFYGGRLYKIWAANETIHIWQM